ncbi:TetR/AcrR family transcriptional regulator [Parashewanella spongiae]|uniref:TetR/AcrR family transcriptional regulator n=1 Tax=Parashewanella spongiae TaxID=342950 RepID=A0A3A6TS12_9GAMM|nr:TetR/AcrR family transcriptional regulator [Parashewanella spongiae]MCL1079049.1 TetR/AcrR family transcriptional regulator [Parashewanella spongiae]RJY10581.1 TetR/AcrR family transcriptional regulator [Parashewanella spongiae]RJY10798.1 TetR/AcrR family transcriptional regulator [Parashewanella spongiae]
MSCELLGALMARPKSYQPEKVVDVALGAFWEKGFAATSLSDLMSVSGLNKRSLYNEFGNKDALFGLVLDRYIEIRSPVAKLLLKTPLGIENIRQYLRNMANETDDRGCLLLLSLSERSLLSEVNLQKVISTIEELNRLIEMNVDASNLSPVVDKKSLSRLISTQSLSIAGMGKLQLNRADITAVTEQFIRLLPNEMPK